MESLVKLRGVTKTYQRGPEKVEVLHGIDLDIPKGDFVALMGPSGSGKTTLLNLIGGLDSPTGGEIEVDSQRIDLMSSGQLSQWRSDNVGFVFQFYNLMPTLNAQKNVELPLLLTRLGGSQRKRNAEIALQLVGLADRGKHRPNELSGGQQQRVAIARAIVSYRRSRPRLRRRDPRAAADAQPRSRQDHRHGDSRPEGRRSRPPYDPSRQGHAGSGRRHRRLSRRPS
jgi:putative ABC transport system ATP-binding protein